MVGRMIASIVCVGLLSTAAYAAPKTATPHAAAAEQDPASTVTRFYQMVFRDHRVTEGFKRFVGTSYTQHNPHVADGPDATIAYLEKRFAEYPQAQNRILRTFVSGDMVALHVHSTLNPQDRGKVIVDIFRVANGKIAEHWDVIQDIPESAANTNGML